MDKILHDKVIEVYSEGHSVSLEGPCDRMARALFLIWMERDYAYRFRVGNSELAEKSEIAAGNITRIRERLQDEFVLDEKPIIIYKTRGRTKAGAYRVNAALLLPEEDIESLIKTSIEHQENIDENIEQELGVKHYKTLKEHDKSIKLGGKENIPSTTTTKSSSRWDVIPLDNLPPLSQDVDISTSNRERLDSFGMQYLRPIDERYYTPSSADTEVLYEIFRQKTPRQVVELAKQAKDEGVADALTWITGGQDAKV